jgi:hypothetical protein
VYGPEAAVNFGNLFAATLGIADIRQWPGYRPVVAAQEQQAQPGDPGGPR